MTSPAERYSSARRRAEQSARLPALSDFAQELPFDLDPFQREACEALEQGSGVLVCAPTGAGKTVVGEFAVHLALAQGRKCFYTTPIKALSNQKYNDLVQRHGAGPGRPADRRQRDQRGRAGGGDDHRGAAQHALHGLGHVARSRLRGHGRGALPGRPVPRRGVGRGDHPPARVGDVGVAVGDRVQRRGVRRLAGDACAARPGWWSASTGRSRCGSTCWSASGCSTCSTTPTAAQMHEVHPELLRYTRELTRRQSEQDFGRGRPGRGRRNTGPPRYEVVERLDREGLLPAILFVFSRAGCDAAVTAVPQRGSAADRSRGTRGDPAHRGGSHRRDPERRPDRARLLGVAGRTGTRARRAPCRHAARVQGGRSRSCSSGVWSRPSSPPRPSPSASTCRPAAWCWNAWSSSTARPTWT